MAIHTAHQVFVPHLARYVTMYDTIAHEGMVVGVEVRTVRVMSDVYDDQITAMVAVNAAGTAFQSVFIGYAYHGDNNKGYNVDASPELKAAYEVFKKKQIEAYHAAERARYAAHQRKVEQERIAECNRLAALPQKGQKVKVVVDGRTKNPHVKSRNGMTGEVFWTRYNSDGDERLGVKFSDAKDARGLFCDVAWVNTKQVQKVA